MHGLEDRIRPIASRGERLAELTGGDLIELEGVGHGPLAREPVLVNTEIRALVERVLPRPATRTWTRLAGRVARGCSTSARRSVWATPAGTSPSPGSCAPGTRRS